MFEILWPIGMACGLLALAGLAIGRTRRIGLALGIIGYSIFGFADISRYRLLERRSLPLGPTTETTVAGLILISFLLFAGTHYLLAANRPEAGQGLGFNSRIKPRPGPSRIVRCREKVFFGALLPLCLTALVLILFYPGLRTNSYFALSGIAVKAFALVSFTLFLMSKRRVFLWISLALLVPSMVETSRRVYVSFFVPTVILTLRSGVVQAAAGKFKSPTKWSPLWRYTALIIATVVLFVFLNFIRSDHDFGPEFRADDRLHNTLFYMRTLKSVDTFYNTGFLIENIPKRFDYFLGKTYLSVAVGPVPRSIWPSKPVGLAAPLALMRVRDSSDFSADEWVDTGMFSLSPGFVGEAHANFGRIGVVVLSVCFGFSTFVFDEIDRRNRARSVVEQLPMIAFAPVFFLAARGDFYSAVFFPLVFSVFCYFLSKLSVKQIRLVASTQVRDA